MKELSGSCKNVKIGDFTSKNADSLKNAKMAEKEIMVVCVGKTSRREILREMEICELQKIQIAGSIIVECN